PTRPRPRGSRRAARTTAAGPGPCGRRHRGSGVWWDWPCRQASRGGGCATSLPSRGRLSQARLGHHPVPEALHAVEEGARLRRVPTRTLADEGRLELLQQLALLCGQVDRRLDHGLAVQVAGAAAAHGLDALLAQAEHLA